MSQTISYTSGSTRAGTVTYSKTSEITVSSLGTTVKARTKVGQVTVTYTGEGSVTAKKTVDIYQAENKVTNSNYNPRITAYGTPTISIGSGLTAAGGSATVTGSVTNTETYNALYSSGAIGPNQTRSVGGSLSISMTANGNSRFSLSGNTITHSSMGTNETTDTITIKAVNDGDSSKSATASKSITNSKTVKSTSGGIYTYGDVIAGTVTNGIIPASGGSATAKAGMVLKIGTSLLLLLLINMILVLQKMLQLKMLQVEQIMFHRVLLLLKLLHLQKEPLFLLKLL